MLKKLFIYGMLFWITFFSGEDCLAAEKSGVFRGKLFLNNSTGLENIRSLTDQLQKIVPRIQFLSSKRDTSGLIMLSDSLLQSLKINKPDSSVVSEIYYYAGVCDLLAEKHNKALLNLKKCITIKEHLGIFDDYYGKALFNAGVALNYIGDFIKVINYMQEYIGLAEKMYGDNSAEVADAYSALAGASIECLDYEGFVDYSFKALGILSQNSQALTGSGLSNLYSIIGVGYARTGDYAKARIYLEKAESIIRENSLPSDKNYINLINSLAFTYGSLGLPDKEDEYFSRGIDLAINNTSSLAFNMINTYAIGLGKSGNVQKGGMLLSGVVKRAREVYGADSRFYIEVLYNYTDYLVYFKKDAKEALGLYDILLDYLERHDEDVIMKFQVMSSYARALFLTGESSNALHIIRELLFSGEQEGVTDIYKNPIIDSIIANRSVLRLLQLKYEILWSLYSGSDDQQILEAAAETSDLMISLIDKIRISISEEESRIVLSDSYRDSYLYAIRDFELCYRKTGDHHFLEKAFEFAERSKVAGLLAATRQLKAVQFHIPQAQAEKEKLLQREIGFYNSRISIENAKEKPDKTLISVWKESLLTAVAARDSLVLTFEKDYPGYFILKYNTLVPEMKDIPSIIGRNYNYINYVISDSLLYIFLVNRKYQELLTFKTDSSFLKNLSDFRILLSDPSQSEAARTKFNNYQQIGFDLFSILIDPIRKYLITDNLLISPDNILSYLPFEAFLSSKYSGSDILYRKLDYLMNDFNISYAYSATFMKESVNRDYRGINRLIAFAPVYTPTINIDSLLIERQAGELLYDLPYARQEAEYVSGITSGKLCINNEASETVFKTEAVNYSIVHLAMHTIVNDQNPMNSAMIFVKEKDSVDDGFLYTYEVYGVPLKAKMVVLSSCNTGNGILSSGEGILSLARGFLYSGSQSVVMSLWKIEDRSGTEIIKMFYDNLKIGMSKSKALKKARHSYLKNASQLRSHPYFWSTLVVFGDNAPVFVPWKIIIAVLILILAVAAFLFYYFRKRRYS